MALIERIYNEECSLTYKANGITEHFYGKQYPPDDIDD